MNLHPGNAGAANGTRYRYWTTREVATLREMFPTGGQFTCAAELPGRTPSAIYYKALQLRLPAPPRAKSPRVRWVADPAIDDQIRRLYQQPPKRGAVEALSVRLGWPRWAVSRRARELGLAIPRFKVPDWSDEELQILADNCHKSLMAIAMALRRRGFSRSETAIQVMQKRRHYKPQDNGYYNAHQLALLFGVDEKTMTRCILLDELKATKRGTARTRAQGGDQWWITQLQVRRFVMDHPHRVDLRKVDRLWFIEMLGGRAG